MTSGAYLEISYGEGHKQIVQIGVLGVYNESKETNVFNNKKSIKYGEWGSNGPHYPP